METRLFLLQYRHFDCWNEAGFLVDWMARKVSADNIEANKNAQKAAEERKRVAANAAAAARRR